MEEEADGSAHMQQSISTMIYNMLKIGYLDLGYGLRTRNNKCKVQGVISA